MEFESRKVLLGTLSNVLALFAPLHGFRGSEMPNLVENAVANMIMASAAGLNLYLGKVCND